MRSTLLLGLFLFALCYPIQATSEDVDAFPVVVCEDAVAESVVSDAEPAVAEPMAADVTEPVVSDVAVTAEPVVVVQPETEAEAGAMVSLLWEAFNAGTWPVVIGLAIMLLVWAVRRFALKTISKKWKAATPWVAAGLGLLSCVGISLSVGTMVWWRALIDGLVSGLLASGLWELIGKHVLGVSPSDNEKGQKI